MDVIPGISVRSGGSRSPNVSAWVSGSWPQSSWLGSISSWPQSSMTMSLIHSSWIGSGARADLLVQEPRMGTGRRPGIRNALCIICGHDGTGHSAGRCSHIFGMEGDYAHVCGCEGDRETL